LPITKAIKDKIGLFCNVPSEAVIQAIDVESIYEVPLLFHKEGLDDLVVEHLDLKCDKLKIKDWEKIVEKIKNPKYFTQIGICGKYTYLKDAYKSIIEAFTHAGVENDSRVELKWIDSENLDEEGTVKLLGDVDGLLIPGGFGERGIKGKIETIKFVRENKIPFLGICLGMQCAVIEFARNVCQLEKAHSYEFDPETPYPVIHLMPDQENITKMGGTMRLGAYPCELEKGSLSHKAYGKHQISERHRHRYEFNNEFRDTLTRAGLKLTGLSPDNRLVEIIELSSQKPAGHPWFVAVQFHPELKSRPTRAHPLFRDLVKAALQYRKSREKEIILKKETVNR
jgi:CTP synthase